ncbi:site-specific integrase [Chitinophaga sp. XS-30]|uniref:site-specific integrase n=1 Tax=Chitinophaga sp. XS-30 TaxID=2604421 RepID=UPI0011DDDF63|nr:site-specific integrase [Chitinophaga sp. XS-30]QEH39470.1 site-specific integrase [Chitinophaga sp. XS-30]
MRTTNTFGVHFWLRKNQIQDGKHPLYVRITVNKKRLELALKQYLSPKDWNASKGEAKNKSPELKEVNSYLMNVRAKLTAHYQDLQLDKEVVTAEMVKQRFLGIDPDTQSSNMTLIDLIDRHIKEKPEGLTEGTIKNYRATKKYLERYLKQVLRRNDITLRELNYDFIVRLEPFIKSTPLKANDPCTINGTMKHLERLKKLTAWAKKQKWLREDPFKSFQLRFKETDIPHLKRHELQRIEEQPDFPNKMLNMVRDLFLFSCYTGLGPKDLTSLKPANILLEDDGNLWIKTRRSKTNISVDVPLLPQALRIIKKYELKEGDIPRQSLFPVVTNKDLNDSLKVIAAICGVQQEVTFYTARHTFATTVTLKNKVPLETVSKLMGHTKLATTLKYAKIEKDNIGQAMEMVKERL